MYSASEFPSPKEDADGEGGVSCEEGGEVEGTDGRGGGDCGCCAGVLKDEREDVVCCERGDVGEFGMLTRVGGSFESRVVIRLVAVSGRGGGSG